MSFQSFIKTYGWIAFIVTCVAVVVLITFLISLTYKKKTGKSLVDTISEMSDSKPNIKQQNGGCSKCTSTGGADSSSPLTFSAGSFLQ